MTDPQAVRTITPDRPAGPEEPAPGTSVRADSPGERVRIAPARLGAGPVDPEDTQPMPAPSAEDDDPLLPAGSRRWAGQAV